MTENTQPKRGILHSPAGPLLWSLLFLAAFTAVFFLQKPSTLVIGNETIKGIFATYGVAAGPVFALLCMMALYLLAGIKRLVGLRRFRCLNPVAVLLVMLPSLALGYQLAYREKPYTDIARGIIGTLAMPLLLSSLVVGALALAWLAWVLLRRPSPPSHA